MKLLADLFACQTSSRFRGIGRYTLALTREMARLRGEHEFVAMYDYLYEDSLESLRQEFIHFLPSGSFLPYFHPPLDGTSLQETLASSLVQQAYHIVSPDVVLTPSPFEGFYEKGVVPITHQNNSSYLRVAVLYDLIPYVFSEQYLEPNPKYEIWYKSRLQGLSEYDLLLAISEATRQDAIEILNIEPQKVVNISSGIYSKFRKINIQELQKKELLNKFGIMRPFVLYLGGYDIRKNIKQGLQAYANLPNQIRSRHQFVYLSSKDEDINGYIKLSGLEKNDIVAISGVSDKELVQLYNLCKVFFFPSLYEGFGLPVLEAMACGAPTIASDNSSLPEVVGRSDALFDAMNVRSMTKALSKVLINETFRNELSVAGLKQAASFSWEKVASSAWTAIENYHQKSKWEKHFCLASPTQEKPKIAYLSPIPPQKSGIADYSEILLPHLAQYFDIDLFVKYGDSANNLLAFQYIKVFSWEELRIRRKKYNAVIYHLGNSEFHTHMPDLLKEIPGVVVLHDFFLSNLPFVREFIYGQKGHFLAELNKNHGSRGVINALQQGIENARVNWPINLDVVQNAQELIVHSEHQIELLCQFNKHGARVQPTIVKQPHNVSKQFTSNEEKAQARLRLGLSPDAYIYISLGIVAPTKLIHLVIRAFSNLLKTFSDIFLVLVGEMDRGDYGRGILDTIEQMELGKNVRLSGYVSKEKYYDYIVAADASVQLRSASRGETSKAVLDCMAYGLPVIVNQHGSLREYSIDTTIQLPEFPSISDISTAMLDVLNNPDIQSEIGKNGYELVRKEHSPEVIAEKYAEVIYRAIQNGEQEIFSSFLKSLISSENVESKIQSAARYAAANKKLRRSSRILIDVTNISKPDYQTGGGYIVKEIIEKLFFVEKLSVIVKPVRMKDVGLFQANRFLEVAFGLSRQTLGDDVSVNIQQGDILCMLDASWQEYESFVSVFAEVKRKGGEILTMVYDLVPVKHPETCHDAVLDVFEAWLIEAIKQSDILLCISQAVADDVEEYILHQPELLQHDLRLAYIHLGADILNETLNEHIEGPIRSQINQNEPSLFLMVGTLEPRKGHSFVLDAFEMLWDSGHEYKLCIAGKRGWKIESLEERIRNHPELGKRLVWIENPSDAELHFLYSASTGVIMASLAEGFGLPIVEAALHEKPVILSDIPVFREVAQSGAVYFSLEESRSLVEAVQLVAMMDTSERKRISKKVPVKTWEESARDFLEVLYGKRAYKILKKAA